MSEITKKDLDQLEQRITASVLAGVLEKIEVAFEKQERRLMLVFDKDFEHKHHQTHPTQKLARKAI